MNSTAALDILKKYFNYPSFRGLQEPIIQSVLEQKDTFGLMPTGGGKSICYQVPALAQEGICIVISPLIALIKDQVEQLKARGIKALSMVGNLTTDQITELFDNALYGKYKFLYLAPERLQQEWILDRITALPVNLVAIDEAHCVSQWGHDFRPAYLNIKTLRDKLPNVTFLAVTASATHLVREDVIKELHLKDPIIFQDSFTRENLAYWVTKTQDKLRAIEHTFLKQPSPGIIYVRNRRATVELASNLNSLGISATYFHGGLSLSDKEKNMELWMQEKAMVMVATNAFGMGIDKGNVKHILHTQLPENLESYYQEAGRAGRNGELAYANLLVNEHDITSAKRQFLEVLPDKAFLNTVYKTLFNFFQIAWGELPEIPFNFNINHFCNKYDLPVVKTFNALQFLDRQSIISLSQEFTKKVSIQFITPSKEVVRYMSLNPREEEVISHILRSYPGIFDLITPINTYLMAKKAGTSEAKVVSILEKLHQQELISYSAQHNDAVIIFNEVREDERTINRIAKNLEIQNQLKINQLQAVIHYTTDQSTCKSMYLLKYFGEENPPRCGICSVCKSDTTPSKINIEDQILSILKQQPSDIKSLQLHIDASDEQIVVVMKELLAKGKISRQADNRFVVN